MGINTDYDSLVNPLVTLTNLQESLRQILADRGSAVGGGLDAGREAFNAAVAEKTRLVEHFKSHNSILRNSLAFLPTAADDVRAALAPNGEALDPLARHVLADVNDTLLLSMVYSHTPGEDKAAEIRSRLLALDTQAKRFVFRATASLGDLCFAHSHRPA